MSSGFDEGAWRPEDALPTDILYDFITGAFCAVPLSGAVITGEVTEQFDGFSVVTAANLALGFEIHPSLSFGTVELINPDKSTAATLTFYPYSRTVTGHAKEPISGDMLERFSGSDRLPVGGEPRVIGYLERLGYENKFHDVEDPASHKGQPAGRYVQDFALANTPYRSLYAGTFGDELSVSYHQWETRPNQQVLPPHECRDQPQVGDRLSVHYQPSGGTAYTLLIEKAFSETPEVECRIEQVDPDFVGTSTYPFLPAAVAATLQESITNVHGWPEL